jgi:hypothetical protein
MKKKLFAIFLFYIFINTGYANWIPLGGGAIQIPTNNQLSINSYSGGSVLPTGNQQSWTDLCTKPRICHGSAIEMSFGGSILKVQINGQAGPQQTGKCYIIPYWFLNGSIYITNLGTTLYQSMADIFTNTQPGGFFDIANMKTYSLPCENITLGTINLYLSPFTGWVNVATYASDFPKTEPYFMTEYRREWWWHEIKSAQGVLACNVIPTTSSQVKENCVQSAPIMTSIGNGIDLPAVEPTICNLSGDGVIDFGNLQASEINGLSKEVDLDLQCNKNTAVSLNLFSNSLSMNGATAKLTMNDKESLKVSLNENQAVNIKLKALLSVNGTPTLGEHSASTVLLYSPE